MSKNRLLAFAAFFFALVAFVLYVVSFLRPPFRGFLFLFMVLNLVFWMTALTIGRGRDEAKLSFRFPKAAPSTVKPLKILLPAFCVVSLIPVLIGGTPIQRDGQLLKKTVNGVLREVSRDEYSKLECAEERLFSGVWFSLDIVFALTLWFKDTR
jgi:hypothetical protein